jgi:HK97 family phage portal protein
MLSACSATLFLVMGIFRRKSEDRTISTWPTWSAQEGSPVTPDNALCVADIYACVRCLSDAAGSLPLIPYRRTDTDRQRLYSGRLHDLLTRPAPATSQANLIGQLVAHLNLHGNGYIGKFRDADGRLEQLGLLHPDRVTVELKAGQPLYTVSDAKTGRQTKHGVEDVLHVRAMGVDGVLGLSPIAQCRLAVSLSRGMGEFAEAFIRNGSRPSGILKVAAGSNKEQMKRTSELTADRHGGSKNAHKIAVVSGDVEWTALSVPADDMQFCEQRKLSTAEIARIFGVFPWMVGGSSGDPMTYSNVEQQSLQFVTYSLRPWLVLIEQAITNDPDLCSASVYVEFLLDGLLRADSKTRGEIYALALDPVKGWMTRDEVRRLENLEPEPQQGAIQ